MSRAMPRRAPQRKREPDPPDIPKELTAAPATLHSGDRWDGVAAGTDVQAPSQVADAQLLETRWTGAQLRERRFTGLRAHDVEFVRCDMSSTVFTGAELRRVTFTDCRLTGMVLSGADITDVRISGSKADLTSFRMSSASHLSVVSSSLRGADFHEFVGENCAFLDCDMDEADFEQSRFRGLRLHGSTLENISGVLALRGAQISASQIAPLGAAVLAAMDVTVTDD